MSYEEAIEWLKGNRSNVNIFNWPSNENFVLCAQCDLATTQQAYWIVRAHKEKLVEADQ
jgi:hypothetical protein